MGIIFLHLARSEPKIKYYAFYAGAHAIVTGVLSLLASKSIYLDALAKKNEATKLQSSAETAHETTGFIYCTLEREYCVHVSVVLYKWIQYSPQPKRLRRPNVQNIDKQWCILSFRGPLTILLLFRHLPRVCSPHCCDLNKHLLFINMFINLAWYINQLVHQCRDTDAS
jgi:hypothetical protein